MTRKAAELRPENLPPMEQNPAETDDSDESICLRYQQGDRLAGEILAERYLQTVRAVTRPYYLAGGDSEDLMQEGMLGFLAALREFSPERSAGEHPFHAYAVVCVRRRVFSAIRQAQGKNQDVLNTAVSIEQTAMEQILTDPAQDPEAAVLREEARRQFAALLEKKLSAFEKRVYTLFLRGYSYREMAQRLGRTERSVDSAVGRIRKKLAAHREDCPPAP